MKMINFFLSFVLLIICTSPLLSQVNGPVTIEGKQFKLNGANFYPMVMNYGVELTRQQNTNWNNSYLTPYVEYGVNAGPNGGPNSYFFECNNLNQCKNDIIADWTYLVSKGFNTIRVAGFYTKFQDNPNKLFFKCRESYMDLEYYINLDPFTPGDPGCTFILDQYENLMQIAEAAGVKLIFNLIGTNSQFTQFPGNNNDEIEFYNAFFNLLASRISISPFANSVLAVDLWNEPCYEDESNKKDKQETCEIVSTWYNTFKSFGTTPLVTLGTCGSGDIWFYDPGVLKVDFFSLHIYPEWRAFEDKTDPAIQQRAISRVYDELYWFNKISPYPWIVGETSLAASANLQVLPQGGANGTLADQSNYAQLIMDATCSCGGSGFSWWWFQDGWWLKDPSEPHPAHWGILERGYATGVAIAEKPIVNTFMNYTLPSVVSSCGPSPISTSSLQSYIPTLTYFNPYQHPAYPSKTIKGILLDQDGNPIANAYVGGHTFVGKVSGNEIHSFHRFFTDAIGYFEIIPAPKLLINPPFPLFYGELHTLLLTSAGGERRKFSAKWLSSTCSSSMPAAGTSPHTWQMKQTNFAYIGEFINIYVVNGEYRDVEAKNQLTIENSIIYAGATSNIRAKSEVHLKSSVHAQSGSLTHIYCEETNINCTNYNSYTMEYKLPGNPLYNEEVDKLFLELQFNIKKGSSGFTATPNPANSFFQLHSESNEEKEINMLNMLGEFITSIRFKNMSEPINISHLSKGVYILMEPQTSEVKKLILQ